MVGTFAARLGSGRVCGVVASASGERPVCGVR
jgi:hypothetical protein